MTEKGLQSSIIFGESSSVEEREFEFFVLKHFMFTTVDEIQHFGEAISACSCEKLGVGFWILIAFFVNDELFKD